MMNWLMVAIGGAIGSCARYGLARIMPAMSYPLATQSANVLGSFLIGLAFAQLSMRLGHEHPAWSLFAVGLLGGFTTFSTFSLDTVRLLEQGRLTLALGYVGTSVSLGLLAAWMGLMLGRRLL